MANPGRDELLVAFKSLAVIYQQTAAEGEAVLEALEFMEPREKDALLKFKIAGEQCLGQLKGWTLETLADLSTATTGKRKTADQLFVELGGAGKSFLEKFLKYDTDGDGLLNAEEFKQACRDLTKGGMTDEEVCQVMHSADISNDGVVDIHEFIVWLYGVQNDGNSAEDVGVLKAKLKAVELELRTKTRAIDQLEMQHEEAMNATHDFWKSVAKHAVMTIETRVDLEHAEWLGNGNYGFVLKARRRRDNREMVVKLMGVRWAHLAVQEWMSGTMVGKHCNIVEYEDVMLHADNDMSIQTLLEAGYESGALKSKRKRSNFPDRYICLTQELMNRGTVQDWLDNNVLLPGGTFVIMQQVACALAFMHRNGVTHNDIKPENIMLHERTENGAPDVKLGDLGLASKSKAVAAQNKDFWQYGMTTFCIISGERFGTRKYKAEEAPQLCRMLSNLVQEASLPEGKVLATYEDVPNLLLKIFQVEVTYLEVQDWPSLQNWDFFEGGAVVDMKPDTNPIDRARHRKEDHSKINQLENLTKEHACERMN